MTPTRRGVLLALLLVVVGCSPAPAPTVPAPVPASAGWTGSWATAATVPGADGPSAAGFTATTLRQVVQLSLGGPTVRLRLTNLFGTTPLVVAATTLGLATVGAPVPVTFGGAAAVTVPVGAEVASDPVPLAAPDGADVLVTTALPGPTGPATQHPGAAATTLAAPLGSSDFRPLSTSWYYLAGLDVPAPGTAGSVVALGDSITDGVGSTAGADRRYPDALAARLLASGRRVGVLNAGIGGNRVLADAGTSGQAVGERLQRDVLDEPGVRTVVLLEGINDIARGTSDPAELTSAYSALADRLHAAGLRLVLGTLTPYGSSRVATPDGERVRDAVNSWIRTAGVADAVVDLDAAVRDPVDPTRLAPAFDSGDGLHPSDAGYAAMAAAVDLATL